MRYTSLLLTMFCLFVNHPAGTGSLVERQLSTVEKVTISVVVPRFEPIPGIPPDKLESEVESRISTILRKYKLEVSESSPQDLMIRIKVARRGRNGLLAILVLSELRESAVLTREWEPTRREELKVTSWRESRIILASPEDVLEKLFEAAELEAEDFAEEVMSAKSARKGGSLVPDPLLGVVNEVDLVVSTGDLGFEPIPELDRYDLQRNITERCEKFLRRAQFKITDTAEAQFLLTLNHAWDNQQRDKVALLISVDLIVPAKPIGSFALAQRKRTLVIWTASRLELGATSDAERIILESVNSALTELLDVRRAVLHPEKSNG